MSELRTLEKCTSQLETALMGLERDLVHFLTKEGFIVNAVRDKVLDPCSSLDDAEKAGELVKRIKNRVKQDPQSYHDLICRLKEGGNHYRPIVKALEEEYASHVTKVPALAEDATSETLSQVTCTPPQAIVSMQKTASIRCEGQLPQSSGSGSISSLPADIRGDLKQQLRDSLGRIVTSFAQYSLSVLLGLKEKQVPVSVISAYLLSLPALNSEHSGESLMLLAKKKDKFERAKNVGEIFIVLNSECCTFLNFDILQALVTGFGLKLNEHNAQYPERLQKYIEMHKITEFIEVKPVLNHLTDDSKELVLLLDIKSTRSLSCLVDIRRAVASIMGLKESALLIHDISLHCVAVTFLIPAFIADFIFSGENPFSQEQKEKFRKLSVQSLQCNGCAFVFTLPCSEELDSPDTLPSYAVTPTASSSRVEVASDTGVSSLPHSLPSESSMDFTLKMADGHKVRDYQRELAQPGVEGKNYIIIAPTGSGKTVVAALVISNHLQKNQLHQSCHVVFVVNTKPLAEQQKRQLDSIIPGARVEVYTGDNPGNIQNSIQQGNNISVCTAGKLLDEIRKGRVTFDQFSLMVFDECHHTRKRHPYAQLMEHYLEYKEKQKHLAPIILPQIIGMTASPGAGGNYDLDKKKTIDHLLKLAAILDADGGFQTVTKNLAVLQRTTKNSSCTRKILKPRNMSGDPFVECIAEEMAKLEESVPKMKNHFERWSQEYKAGVQKVKRPLELGCDRRVRDTISTLNLLRCYSNVLRVYMDLQQHDAITELENYRGFPEDEKATPHECDAKHRMKVLVSELKMLQPSENPLLEIMMATLLDTFQEKPASQAIFFIRTKNNAYSMRNWVREHPKLQALKPDVITGHTRETGSGMTQVEQEKVMDRFRKGQTNLLIATSVAEEELDVPECNVVIKFRHVSNEIAQVQTEGRPRAENSQGVMILSSDSRKKYRELMSVLEEEILEGNGFPAHQQLKDRLNEIQQDIIAHRRMKAKMVKAHTDLSTVKLFCKKCKVLACSGRDIYIFGKKSSHHYVVPESKFKEKIRCSDHPSPHIRDLVSREVRMIHKIYCVECGQSWGVMCTWVSIGRNFPVIKCSAFTFEIAGITRTIKKWKDAPFNMMHLSVFLTDLVDDSGSCSSADTGYCDSQSSDVSSDSDYSYEICDVD